MTQLHGAFDFGVNAMFNAAMNPSETTSLIDAAGGDTAFAKLLGIDGKEGFQQRVNNWRRRGMPASVVLEHYEIIKKLQSESAGLRKSRRSTPLSLG